MKEQVPRRRGGIAPAPSGWHLVKSKTVDGWRGSTLTLSWLQLQLQQESVYSGT